MNRLFCNEDLEATAPMGDCCHLLALPRCFPTWFEMFFLLNMVHLWDLSARQLGGWFSCASFGCMELVQ